MSNETEPSTPAEQVVLLSTAPDGRDVTAELAAPPRRRLPWVPLVLSAAVIATAAFAGGVQYQRDQGPDRASGASGRTAAAGAQQPRPGRPVPARAATAATARGRRAGVRAPVAARAARAVSPGARSRPWTAPPSI